MTIRAIENLDDLPWGLHDAYLERIDIDWIARRLTMEARVKIDERQTTERRLRIVVTNLVYCAIEPPHIDPKTGYEATPARGLWIDSSEVNSSPGGFPDTPPDAFLHRFFVHDWNRSIHICASDATWQWLEPTPLAVQETSGFYLPGEEVPDP